VRSVDKSKGINKITFSQVNIILTKYYNLPGIISERLFAVFDKNKSDHIDQDEFINGMTVLFSESFDKLAGFIFNLYDFNKDNLISREDIRVVLSYVPILTKQSDKFEK
jgi:Ca2+-binding EF-hand superfamily protein